MADLTTLVTKINAEYTEFVTAVRHTLTRAKALGELLITAKKQFKRRGEFDKWVTTNFTFTPRTASNYMSVFANWDRFDVTDLASLTLPEFLYSIRTGKQTTDESKTTTKAKRKPKVYTVGAVHEAAKKYQCTGDVLGLLREFGVKVEAVRLAA